jgi:dihydroorotate dehydrogenase
MGWLYQNAIKPALFRLDAEQAHELSVHALALLGQVRPLCAVFERLQQLPAAAYRPINFLTPLAWPPVLTRMAGLGPRRRL